MIFQRRPFAQSGIADLEARAGKDNVTDTIILAELDHRNTVRAAKLRRQLIAGQKLQQGARAEVEQVTLPPAPICFSARPAQSPQAPGPIPARQKVPLAPRAPIEPLASREDNANTPVDILQAWTALEVMSPVSFRDPVALAGDVKRVARFDRGLPWVGGTKSPQGTRLYFQIVLGTIDMAGSIDQLLQRFGDGREERPQARGKTPLAVVIVDRDGRPIENNCATVSSFGWGLPVIMRDGPAALARWSTEAESIERALHDRVFRNGDDGKPLPLDENAIGEAYAWLASAIAVDPNLLSAPSFAIRSIVTYKSKDPPEPLLLNSFFLKDLNAAHTLCADGKAPDLLQRYLGSGLID